MQAKMNTIRGNITFLEIKRFLKIPFRRGLKKAWLHDEKIGEDLKNGVIKCLKKEKRDKKKKKKKKKMHENPSSLNYEEIKNLPFSNFFNLDGNTTGEARIPTR